MHDLMLAILLAQFVFYLAFLTALDWIRDNA